MGQTDKAERTARVATSWHFKGSPQRRRVVKKVWTRARRRLGKLLSRAAKRVEMT